MLEKYIKAIYSHVFKNIYYSDWIYLYIAIITRIFFAHFSLLIKSYKLNHFDAINKYQINVMLRNPLDDDNIKVCFMHKKILYQYSAFD